MAVAAAGKPSSRPSRASWPAAVQAARLPRANRGKTRIATRPAVLGRSFLRAFGASIAGTPNFRHASQEWAKDKRRALYQTHGDRQRSVLPKQALPSGSCLTFAPIATSATLRPPFSAARGLHSPSLGRVGRRESCVVHRGELWRRQFTCWHWCPGGHPASSLVRFGFPVSIGWGSQETKLALYFLRAGTDQRRPHASSARPQKFGTLLDAAFEPAKPIPEVSLEPGRRL